MNASTTALTAASGTVLTLNNASLNGVNAAFTAVTTTGLVVTGVTDLGTITATNAVFGNVTSTNLVTLNKTDINELTFVNATGTGNLVTTGVGFFDLHPRAGIHDRRGDGFDH